MYNEKLKMQFISNYTHSENTANHCATIFNAFSKFEEEWGADLCTKTTEELQPAVDSVVGLRSRTQWSRLIILKDYVNWCIENDVPNACDGMLKIQTQTTALDKIKQQTLSNPLHLQRYLNSICDAEKEETIDNIYRCYYWLAFGGISEEDILNVKCNDVDLENMVVRYKTTEVPIYREALPAFRNCMSLTQFAYKHPNYNKIIYKDRVSGDTLIRGLRSMPTVKSMRVELSRRSKTKLECGATDLKMSFLRVWISGLFFRMYEREQAGIPVDFSAAASNFMEGKTYQLKSGRNTTDAKKRQIAKDYLKDYERWKLAYKK